MDSIGAITVIDTGGNFVDDDDGVVVDVEEGEDGCVCGRDNGNGIVEGKTEGTVVSGTRTLER